MKRKTVRVTALLVCVILLVSLTGCGLFSRHRDITGVTTLTDENTVIMNSPSGTEFVSGSGVITVKEGQAIRLTYEILEGSFDLALNAGDGSLGVFESADLGNLTSEGDVFGVSGVTGTGELEIEAAAGEYTVFFKLHGAVGSATVEVGTR